ncbi:hypothetical protein N7530_006268, partial [Penicillium desertorum]
IGEYNVIITILPDSKYRIASAASVAINIFNSFYNIRIGLIVRISGGVLSESYNIYLGDVIVSTPRDSKSDRLFYPKVIYNLRERADNEDTPTIHYSVIALVNINVTLVKRK